MVQAPRVTPLSSDMVRHLLFDDATEQRYQDLVFGTLRSLLRARLIARMPMNHVDATNLSPKERRHWIRMAKDFGYDAHAVYFDVPMEVCMDRNRRRNRRSAGRSHAADERETEASDVRRGIRENSCGAGQTENGHGSGRDGRGWSGGLGYSGTEDGAA